MMVIENDIRSHEICSICLIPNGCKIIKHCYDNQEAIEFYRSLIFEKKPLVIIMNFDHDNYSGLDTAKEILKINPKQKLLFICENRVKIPSEFANVPQLKKPVNFYHLVREMVNLTYYA